MKSFRADIVSSIFPPEPIVSARTSEQIAAQLVFGGAVVTVLTAYPSRPKGRLYSGFNKKLYETEIIDNGCRIVRCFSLFSSRSTFYSRFCENISFGLTSAAMLLFKRRPDVLYANTWPIFAIGFVAVVAKIRRIPLVISVQDVYPESIAIQGRLSKDHIFMRCLRMIDSLIARNAHHIVVISNKFKEIYHMDREVESSRISVIPNWFDHQKIIDKDVDRASFRKKNGVSNDDFLVVYGGNIGVAAGVDLVIKAASLCNDIPNIKLMIAGDGSKLAECRELSEKFLKGGVIFYSPWPSEDTAIVLKSADLLVLPTKGEQSLASVPSKLITYMFAAKPVIALAVEGSEIDKIVKDSGCGWVIEPGDLKSIQELICMVHSISRKELDARGLRGREYALKYFTYRACLPKLVNIIYKSIS